MVKPLFDSSAEKLIFDYLTEFINTEDYSIHVHKPLRDVFDELQPHKCNEIFEQFCKLNDAEMFSDAKSELSHFDFVIYSMLSDMPALIVEVNGTSHEKNPSHKNMDHFKQFICTKNDIPLVPLKLYKSYKRDEMKAMLKASLEQFHDRYNYPVFCDTCHVRMNYKKNSKNGSFFYSCSHPLHVNPNNPTRPYSVNEDIVPPLLKADV